MDQKEENRLTSHAIESETFTEFVTDDEQNRLWPWLTLVLRLELVRFLWNQWISLGEQWEREGMGTCKNITKQTNKHGHRMTKGFKERIGKEKRKKRFFL